MAQDAAEKAVVGIPALAKKRRKLSDLETAMVVVDDRFSGEDCARWLAGGGPQYAGYMPCPCRRAPFHRVAGGKPATYLTALSQPNLYRLNTDLPMRRFLCASRMVGMQMRRRTRRRRATAKAGK